MAVNKDTETDFGELEHVASFPLLNPQPITELGLEGKLSFINPSARKLFPDLEKMGQNHQWLKNWKETTAICIKEKKSTCDRDVLVNERWYHQTLLFLPDDRTLRIYGTDVTNLKQAEELTQKQELLLKSSIEGQKDTIIAGIDKGYKYLFFNKAHWDSMMKTYHKDVKVGMNILDCVTLSEDRKAAKENYGRALAGESHSNIRKYGNVNSAYFESFFNPILDERKEIIGATALASDVTDRIKKEEELTVSKQRYQDLFVNMINGFAYHKIITDKKGVPIDYEFLEINESFEKMTGLDRIKSIGKRVTEVIPNIEKDRANWIGRYGKVALTGKGEIFENYSESLKKWFKISAYCPKKGFFATVFEDITELKQNEEEILNSKQQLTNIINMLPDATFVIDLNGVVTIWNREAEEFTGVKAKDIVGKGNYEYSIPFYGIRRPMIIDLLRQPVKDIEKLYLYIKKESDRIVGEGYTQSIKEGGTYILVTAAPIYNLEGEKVGAVESIHDITEHKLTEKRLLELDKLKDDFLSVTTHELKTPLIPIKLQSQLLLAGDYGELNQSQKEAVEMILRNGNVLDSLSSEVLDIAKIKSNKLKLVLEKTWVQEVIFEVVNGVITFAKQKKIDITLSPVSKIPKMMVDKLRIKQIMFNLLDNAVKFTPENGRILVEIKKQNNEIIVSVKDSGIGISKENIKKLFTPFFQIDSSYSRKYRGTGLGLAVSKGLVESHGGKIWAKSGGEGKGSTFIFSLPIKN